MIPAHFYEEQAQRYAASDARPSLAYVDILARRARAGDTDAMSELCEVLASLAAALSVTNRVGVVARSRSLEVDDLRQEAMCAMLRALKKWDPAKGAFRTYAYAAARYAILDAVNAAHSATIPKAAAAAARRGQWDRAAFRPRTRAQAEAATSTPVSMDAGSATTDEEGRYPAAEWLGEVDQDYEHVMDRMVLEQAFRRARWMLKDQERRALSLRFGLDGAPALNVRETAEELGVSGERGRQIALAGLKRLRMAAGVKAGGVSL